MIGGALLMVGLALLIACWVHRCDWLGHLWVAHRYNPDYERCRRCPAVRTRELEERELEPLKQAIRDAHCEEALW